jgi:hypothetical protein
MDPRTRWETEALRGAPAARPGPPRPTAKRRRGERDDRAWVTLREAETATSIPVSTLRKWVRRAGLPSYLESDGETPVRMVDLDAVRHRAEELGRVVSPLEKSHDDESRVSSLDKEQDPSAPQPRETRDPRPETRDPTPDTMLVPVDAWNKMLAQLGNLHEAGQQLAEARERAAKAETEAEFLRRRLAELRSVPGPEGSLDAHTEPDPEPQPEQQDAGAAGEDDAGQVSTTSYWRYLTVGWRNRRRRSEHSAGDDDRARDTGD